MKKLGIMLSVCSLLMMFVISIIFVSIASGESEGSFIFSAQSNSIWVLNKSTRKMIFVQFKKPGTIWKSNQVTVPTNFNSDECALKAVGSRGTSVFLYEKSSAMTTFYQVQKDHSVNEFMVVNIGEDLK